jgi:hypothetical protein
MKNTIKHLFLSVSILLFTCAFIEKPAVTMTPPGGAYAVFAGKFGGDITKKEIAENQKLSVEGCARGSEIFKFTLNITKNGKTNSYQSESNILNKELISKLKELSPGDAFEFTKTKAYLPNGKDVVDVHGRKFVVVKETV